MARMRRLHQATRRGVRRTLEIVILVLGLVAGLAIVGACGGVGLIDGESAPALDGGLALGLFVALLLVGTVFLFTTMSRDLRLLRAKYDEDEDEDDAPPVNDTVPPAAPPQAGV